MSGLSLPCKEVERAVTAELAKGRSCPLMPALE